MRWSLLLAAVLVLFISLISAQAPSATTTTPTTTLLVTGASSTASPSAAYYRYIKTLYELSPSAIASGVFFLLGGMTLLFFGYRLFKPMLFLAGMYTVMILSFVILTKLEPDDGYSNPDAVLFWPPMALGLLGGGLALFLYRVGLVCLGLLGGFSLSLFLLSLRSQGKVSL